MAWDFDGPPMHGPGAGRYYRERYPAGYLAAECPASYSHKRHGGIVVPYTSQVYLDGVLVDASTISAARHQFIGTFREPTSPYPRMGEGFYHCPCGDFLEIVNAVFVHWQAGHWDIPQYQSLLPQKGVAHAHQEEG